MTSTGITFSKSIDIIGKMVVYPDPAVNTIYFVYSDFYENADGFYYLYINDITRTTEAVPLFFAIDDEMNFFDLCQGVPDNGNNTLYILGKTADPPDVYKVYKVNLYSDGYPRSSSLLISTDNVLQYIASDLVSGFYVYSSSTTIFYYDISSLKPTSYTISNSISSVAFMYYFLNNLYITAGECYVYRGNISNDTITFSEVIQNNGTSAGGLAITSNGIAYQICQSSSTQSLYTFNLNNPEGTNTLVPINPSSVVINLYSIVLSSDELYVYISNLNSSTYELVETSLSPTYTNIGPTDGINIPWTFALYSTDITSSSNWVVLESNNTSLPLTMCIPAKLSQNNLLFSWDSSSSTYQLNGCGNATLPSNFICAIVQMAEPYGNSNGGYIYNKLSTTTNVTNQFAYGTINNNNIYEISPVPAWTPWLTSSVTNGYVCGPFLSYNPPDGSTTTTNLTLTGNLYYCGIGNSYDISNSSNGIVSSINFTVATDNAAPSSSLLAFQMLSNLAYYPSQQTLQNFTSTVLLVPYINPTTNSASFGVADFIFTIPNISALGSNCFNECPSGSGYNGNGNGGFVGYAFAYSNSDNTNPNLNTAMTNGYSNVPTSQQCFIFDPQVVQYNDIISNFSNSQFTMGAFSSIAGSDQIAQAPSITVTIGGNLFTYTYTGCIAFNFGGNNSGSNNTNAYPCMGQVNYTNNPSNSTYGVGTVANFNSSLYYIGSYDSSSTSTTSPGFLFGNSNLFTQCSNTSLSIVSNNTNIASSSSILQRSSTT